VVVATIPTVAFLAFQTGAVTISSKKLLNFTHKAEWALYQNHYLSESLEVPATEPGTLGYVTRNSDHYTTGTVFDYVHNRKVRLRRMVESELQQLLVFLKTQEYCLHWSWCCV
jgi:hypothetical protein